MAEFFLAFLGMAFAVGMVLALRHVWRRERLLRRLLDAEDFELGRKSREPSRRGRWLSWSGFVGAGITFPLLAFLVGMQWGFAAVFSALAGVLVWMAAGAWKSAREFRMETQLADAIEIVVSTLRAGAGVLEALESGARESREPLRPVLEELTSRIRLGDDVQALLRALSQRIPLETFQLFFTTLSVHWEVGGSLAPTLATVARTIRDRIEIARRVRSQSTQAQLSVLGILGITYFIALLMWTSAPERMEGMLKTSLGAFFAEFALLMQAVGLLWMSRLIRIRI